MGLFLVPNTKPTSNIEPFGVLVNLKGLLHILKNTLSNIDKKTEAPSFQMILFISWFGFIEQFRGEDFCRQVIHPVIQTVKKSILG